MSKLSEYYGNIQLEYNQNDDFWVVNATKYELSKNVIIAYIDNQTARVFYVDNDARNDPYAQNIINNKIDAIKTNLTKTIEIHGVVQLPISVSHDDFLSALCTFFEANGWSFGGRTIDSTETN